MPIHSIQNGFMSLSELMKELTDFLINSDNQQQFLKSEVLKVINMVLYFSIDAIKEY